MRRLWDGGEALGLRGSAYAAGAPRGSGILLSGIQSGA